MWTRDADYESRDWAIGWHCCTDTSYKVWIQILSGTCGMERGNEACHIGATCIALMRFGSSPFLIHISFQYKEAAGIGRDNLRREARLSINIMYGTHVEYIR